MGPAGELENTVGETASVSTSRSERRQLLSLHLTEWGTKTLTR